MEKQMVKNSPFCHSRRTMPPSTKHATRQRKTLAHQIKELASKDWLSALHLASGGKQFTNLEAAFEFCNQMKTHNIPPTEAHKQFQKQMESIRPEMRKINAQIRRLAPKAVKAVKLDLCRVFLKAVDDQDVKKLYEIADAMKAVKDHKDAEQDPRRVEILMWKGALTIQGQSWTVAKLAEIMHWPSRDADDGYSQLRRMCRELGFPLSPSSRKIRAM